MIMDHVERKKMMHREVVCDSLKLDVCQSLNPDAPENLWVHQGLLGWTFNGFSNQCHVKKDLETLAIQNCHVQKNVQKNEP